MRYLSISVRIALLSLLVLLFAGPTPARAQDASATLQNAVQRFNDGDYLGAQELLTSVDRSKLSPQDQAKRDDYVNRVQTAIKMLEKAQRDFDDAQRATQDGNTQRAAELLDGVLANEYAPQNVRESAAALKLELQSAPPRPKENAAAPAPQTPDPTPPRHEATEPRSHEATEPRSHEATKGEKRAGAAVDLQTAPSPSAKKNGTTGIAPADVEKAKALTGEGNDMIRGARYDEAERLFEQALSLVPGYPEAVDGLRQVAQHRQNVAGPAVDSLIERIRREDAINWQRAVAEYRDVENTIRDHVANERFDEANQLLIRANQIVDSGKQFADPVTKYESLRSEADALAKFLADAERNYNEREVAQRRRQIEEQRAQRLREDEENRRQQVEKLMTQAEQHRKDGDLDAAINVLKQVTVIDPKYREARWRMDDLEALRENRRGRNLRDDFTTETQKSLNDVEEAKIPWSELLIYPKNWNDINSRPERGGSGSSRRSGFISALDSPVPIDFQQTPFDRVIEKLAASQNLNVIVKWHDLQRVGIEPNTPITLRVPNEISLKRALTEVLDQASGGGIQLGFDIEDEAVVIATRETLDKNTIQVVYDITDLLMEIPNFNDAPMTDLTEANSRNGTPKTVTPATQSPWADHGDDDAEAAPADPDRARRVHEIIGLIEDTVAPASWRDRGGSIGNISEINGQLVITQNTAGQRAIGDLLGKLRDQRAIQIAVEARFITVASHYLEELGMDLDIVLNSGNAGFDYIPGPTGPVTDPVLGNPLLLPRSFSRLGFTPATPALGIANLGNTAVAQPGTNPALIPPRGGGSGRQGTPVPVVNRTSSFTDPSNLGSDVPGSFAGQALPPALSIFGSFLDNIQVDFLIRATQADSRTTVLTAPQLVLFNGQRSWVAVTIQQNFVSQLNPVVSTGAAAQAPQIGTIDSGAVLDVNATVTVDKRYVTMTIRPGVTRLLDLQTIPFSGGVAGGGFGGGPALAAFIQLPTLSSQRVQTTVSVPDGGTLLIGGQKLASETEVEAGVPILSKIPILKRAYSSRSMVKDEQTLLILIKPKIMIQSEQEELAFPSFSQR